MYVKKHKTNNFGSENKLHKLVQNNNPLTFSFQDSLILKQEMFVLMVLWCTNTDCVIQRQIFIYMYITHICINVKSLLITFMTPLRPVSVALALPPQQVTVATAMVLFYLQVPYGEKQFGEILIQYLYTVLPVTTFEKGPRMDQVLSSQQGSQCSTDFTKVLYRPRNLLLGFSFTKLKYCLPPFKDCNKQLYQY